MAKANVSEYDVVAANNTDISSINITGTGLVSTADDSFRANSANLAKWWSDIGGVNTVAGTADAITVTTPTVYGALKTGMRFNFKASAANTGAATLNFDALGAKAIRKISGGTDVALTAGDIPGANARIDVIYDAAANGAAGAWVLTVAPPSAIAFATNAQAAVNLALAASVGANALTIAIKGVDGNDPSASNVVYIPFRSVTAGSGDTEVIALSAATSIVVSSGSTLGTTSAQANRIWVVAFNDGGTLRLGAINCLSSADIYPLASNGIASSTAEGGAGAADSAHVFYSGTAVSSKAYTILGYVESTQATAGTWATSPSVVRVMAVGVALPGDVVQSKRASTSTATSTTSASYVDTNLSATITPTSAANVVEVSYQATCNGNAAAPIVGLHRGSTQVGPVTYSLTNASLFATHAATWVDVPATTSATVYMPKIKSQTGGVTVSFADQGVASIATIVAKEVVA